MKMRVMQVALAVSVLAASSAVLAGGAACDSMKGHKDMSPEAMKEFKEHHGWSMEGHGDMHGKDEVKAAPQEVSPKVIKL